MAGYREFQTGEVLTAANVDDFLAKQAVQKYADAAARDAALGTAVAGGNALREGMVAYLDDTNDVLKYDGTSWTQVGEASGLVEVKSAIFAGTQTASVTAGANVAITDVTITHEVADPANKLIISAFTTAGNSQGNGDVGIAVHDGTGLIAVGGADGNRTQVTAGGWTSIGGDNRVVHTLAVTFVHVPGAGSKTYTLRLINVEDATQTLYVNRNQVDSNIRENPRAVSSLVIQEVRA